MHIYGLYNNTSCHKGKSAFSHCSLCVHGTQTGMVNPNNIPTSHRIRSEQENFEVFGKAHMRFNPSLRGSVNTAFETAPTLI